MEANAENDFHAVVVHCYVTMRRAFARMKYEDCADERKLVFLEVNEEKTVSTPAMDHLSFGSYRPNSAGGQHVSTYDEHLSQWLSGASAYPFPLLMSIVVPSAVSLDEARFTVRSRSARKNRHYRVETFSQPRRHPLDAGCYV